MKVRSVTPMRIAKIGYIITALILLVLGLLLTAFPHISVKRIEKMLGIIMILFGIIRLTGYFSKDLYRLAFQYDLQFGILILAVGLLLLLKSSDVIQLLFVAKGTVLLADGLFRIQVAVDSRKFGIKHWWGIFTLAIITSIAALTLTFMPSENDKVLTMLLGITLIIEGVLNFFTVITTVKIIKHQYPDFIDEDYLEMEDEYK